MKLNAPSSTENSNYLHIISMTFFTTACMVLGPEIQQNKKQPGDWLRGKGELFHLVEFVEVWFFNK